MEKWRIAALLGLIGAMLTGAIVTWGSIGSAMLIYGVLTAAAAMLYQKFLNRDDPDDWSDTN